MENRQHQNHRIVLFTGPKHSGKTSVGRALAALWGCTFTDLDQLVETMTGRSPRDLYRKGPEVFRKAEARALRNLLNTFSDDHKPSGKPLVAAAGGGIVDNEEALDILKTNQDVFQIVYLDIPPDTAWERIQAKAAEDGELPPFLDTADPQGDHLAQHRRRALEYKKLAHIIIQAQGKSAEQIAGELAAAPGAGEPRKFHEAKRLFSGDEKASLDIRRKTDMFLLILALVVLAVLLVINLKNPKLKIPGLASAAEEQLVFTSWWRDELERNTLETIAGEFEALNPHIKITLNDLSYNTIQESLKNQAAEEAENILFNTDIIGLDPLWLGDLIADEQLAPVDGEKALPLISFMPVLFYNIDALKAAGFNRPPGNWNEVIEISRALKALSSSDSTKEKQYGLGMALAAENSLGVYQEIFPWFWAAGISFIQDDKAVFSGRTVNSALEFLNTMRREEYISPDVFAKTPEQKRDEFIRGKISMMIAPVQEAAIIRPQMGPGPGIFGITTIPGPVSPPGKTAFGISTWAAGISAQSKHPEEARAFLAFLEEKAPALADAAHAVPGAGFRPSDYNSGDALYDKAWDMFEGGEAIREFDGLPHFQELSGRFREELSGLFDENKSAAETAAAIRKKWETIFAE